MRFYVNNVLPVWIFYSSGIDVFTIEKMKKYRTDNLETSKRWNANKSP